MEVQTPKSSSTPDIDEYGCGGNGQVMIWALLANDDDHEMLQMTDTLEKVIGPGRVGGRLDSTENSLPKGVGFKLGGGRTLYVTGHSRYKEANGKIIPLAERKLGGFPVDDVVQALHVAVTELGVSYIEFWCCETACGLGSDHLEGDSKKRHVVDCTFDSLRKLGALAKAQNAAAVSTIDLVTVNLCSLILKHNKYYVDTLYITGLNGVGYFEKGDAYICTFDQTQMLDTVNTVGKLEKAIEDGDKGQYTQKNLDQAQLRLRKHMAARKCHFIVNCVPMSVVRMDAQKFAKAEKEKAEKAKTATSSSSSTSDKGATK